jgi:hypothetical protein
MRQHWISRKCRSSGLLRVSAGLPSAVSAVCTALMAERVISSLAMAGLGISLLALTGPPPEGLVEVRALPPAQAISLTARARPGADRQAVRAALRVLHETLG